MHAATSRSRRISVRGRREDGEETKARIIEVAGRLFAERGFAEVTGKEICEAAGTNLTAVNYHFGSREALYMLILDQMRGVFMNSPFCAEMAANDLGPREKLEAIIDKLVEFIYERDSWQVQLWARETISPSPVAVEFFEQRAAPKFDLMEAILSEITGVPRGTVPLAFCVITVMAPFKVLLISGGNRNTPEARLLRLGREKIARQMKRIVLAGLDNFAAKYAAGEMEAEEFQ